MEIQIMTYYAGIDKLGPRRFVVWDKLNGFMEAVQTFDDKHSAMGYLYDMYESTQYNPESIKEYLDFINEDNKQSCSHWGLH